MFCLIKFEVHISCSFYSEFRAVCSRQWSSFGFSGEYILSGFVQMSFCCFFSFGVMFVDIFNGEENPACKIYCA